MEKFYRRWLNFQDKFIAPIAAVLLFGPILLAIIEIIRRYILGVSWEWQQDIVTYFIISASYFFFAITQRDQGHLQVGLFINMLRKKIPTLGSLISIVAHSASTIYLCYFIFYGIKMTKNSYLSGRLVYSQIMPFWPFFLILTLGMTFMLISIFFQIHQEIEKIKKKEFIAEEPSPKHK